MIISHKYKFIFIHFPKAAGTSMRDFFYKRIPQEEIDESEKYHVHTAASVVKELPFWNSYFKFGFVRNPWDMVVSAYFFYFKNKEEVAKKCPTIELFFQNLEFLGDFYLHPATYYFFDGDNNLMDYIGKYEDLPNSFDYCLQRIGLTGQLEFHNASEHKHYSYYYDEHWQNVIGERYGNDVSTWKYCFERK
jgi:hypothetical protein